MIYRGHSLGMRLAGVAWVASIWGLMIGSDCYAQIEYSPHHPDVETMVRNAVKYFTDGSIPKGSGEQVLGALAIVEAAKRYDNEVPTENSLVQQAVTAVLNDLENGFLVREIKIYYPCLALILLCDVDSNKYEPQIKLLIQQLVERQEPSGSYTYIGERGKGRGDTSQTQYVALALWVAYRHGFKIPLQTPQKALEWLLSTNQPNGSWYYTYQNGGPAENNTFFMSIHAACAGTVYLLADLLQLNTPPSTRRGGSGAPSEAMALAVETGTGLPPSISIYVPPREEDEWTGKGRNDGPLVRTDMGKLASVKRAANQYFRQNFQVDMNYWGYYYLYAVERYAFFREKAEGSFREVPDWYDQGVRHLQTLQQPSGSFRRRGLGEANEFQTTCFAILFLVRSSEILILPSGEGNLSGNIGLKSNVRLDVVNGKIKSFDVIKGLDDVLELLGSDDIDLQQYELIQDSLAKAIGQLSNQTGRSQREHLLHLRGLVSDRNYFKRLIAVKLLSRQQEMDNVPALIYALGDPDLRICREAHNGLRLISRKLDEITLSENADYAECQNVKRQWTRWFLSIRPGAEMLD